MASITATVSLNLDLCEVKILRDFIANSYSADQLQVFWKSLSEEEKKMISNLHDALNSLGD